MLIRVEVAQAPGVYIPSTRKKEINFMKLVYVDLFCPLWCVKEITSKSSANLNFDTLSKCLFLYLDDRPMWLA